MGCSNSSKPAVSAEEKKISSVQSSWKLKNFESQTLITALSLITNELVVTDCQFKHVLITLGIKDDRLMDFFYHFTKQAPCPAKKIQCLFIILGQSSLKKKCKLFFKVYAETRLRLMVKSEAELMVSHLLQILLLEIPEYCCSIHPDDKDLQEYCYKTCIFTNPLLKYFINKMMGSNLDMICSEMIKNFESDEELRFIIKGKKLRSFCFDTFQRQINLTENRFKSANVQKKYSKDETVSADPEASISMS